MNNQIILKKVTVNNLKNINLSLKPFEFIVFTGVSGSGKSSLAFDTIYKEGQRRYIASLPHQSRRFLKELPKPKAEIISGLSPTVAIEQKALSKSPRSTVGTITGIYDYLRVLFSKVGIPHCPLSQEKLTAQSKEKIIKSLQNLPLNTKIILLAPLAKDKKKNFKEEFKELLKRGFLRVRVDGKIFDLTQIKEVDPKVYHNIDIVIDRIVIGKNSKERIAEAVGSALDIGKGLFYMINISTKEEKTFSTFAFSAKSQISYPPLTPSNFSFNHPSGMCENCQGLKEIFEFDLDKIIDPNLSIAENCLSIASPYQTIRYGNIYNNLARLYNFDVNTPWKNLTEKAKHIFLYGTEKKWTKMLFVHPLKKIRWQEYVHWQGALHEAHDRLLKAKSESYKKKMQAFMKHIVCPSCQGHGIKAYPAACEVGTKKIFEISSMTICSALHFFSSLQLPPIDMTIAHPLIQEIQTRLKFLIDVGLHYLSLDRSAPTLSGGEAQRVKLASLIGSGLSQVTYILDEPSIGLHPHDHHKLIKTLKKLKEKKNTVIVIEHDKDMIQAADTIVDIGPKGGTLGGEIIAKGDINTIVTNPRSITGKYLSRKYRTTYAKKRKPSKEELKISRASCHNLRNIDVKIPLHCLVCITGVSGSGKSSLISDTLYPAIFNNFHKSQKKVGAHEKLEGIEHLEKVLLVDQSPIGRSIRSTPATYIKLYDEIREFFANLPESKIRGFTPSHFSFNVSLGTCPYCRGLGKVKVNLDFKEDVWTECAHCKNKRFDQQILSIYYQGKNINDILDMEVREAFDLFSSHPKIRSKLQLLQQVGLEYLPLGQAASTLSGGEAQRIKLAKELVKSTGGKTLYILDEPTTGLHLADVEKLIGTLQKLVDNQNSVIVIEHNMEFVQAADWVIDLGPKAADEGGRVVAEGPPEKLARMKTPTGIALKEVLSATPLKKKKTSPLRLKTSNIKISKAQQNNLKKLDVEIPHGKISIFTGPSGSGKSSLAFDTIYAEAHMRYLETLPLYIRQFLKQPPKAKVEKIENLSCAIAIEQQGHTNPRSTVATLSEVYDIFRILFSQLGVAYSPETQEKIQMITKSCIIDRLLSLPQGEKVQILAPLSPPQHESFKNLLERLNKEGFLKIRLNKKYWEIDEKIPFDPSSKNELLLVVDRIIIDEKIEKRAFEAITLATTLSSGSVVIAREKSDIYFRLGFIDEKTNKSYPSITPQTFSFNSEKGMCLECHGLGYVYGVNLALHPLFTKLTTSDIINLLFLDKKGKNLLIDILKVDPTIPLKNLPAEKLNTLLNGSSTLFTKNGLIFRWKGINPTLAHLAKHAKAPIKENLLPLMEEKTCPECIGSRLNALARNVKIKDLSIGKLCSLSLDEAFLFVESIQLPEEKKNLLQEKLSQVKGQLLFLKELGLGYLSLDRSAPTLSAGEMQRIKLSRQLGSSLTSCIYILDEPTIGLHPYNIHLLIKALKKLKDLGNTLILVEQDLDIIKAADMVFDLGPRGGIDGGYIMARGNPDQIAQNPKSLTGAYLSGQKRIPLPSKRREVLFKLSIKNGSLHNLKNINLSLPKNGICCITGISGAGKSTLIYQILKPAVDRGLREKKDKIELDYATVEGIGHFTKLIALEQKPVIQSTKADVGTYSEILPLIRAFFAQLPFAKTKGLKPRHFSYNHISGMCRSCWGRGYKNIKLHFLPPVKIRCESCHGYRLTPLSLSVTYKNMHLGQILEMTIYQAQDLFSSLPQIARKLKTLISVGLDYLKLGQEIPSLSVGEVQRVKLAKALSKRHAKNTLYLLDEPSKGLHNIDIEKLLKIFHQLADKNNALVIIEHNLDIIANSDYIIDLGPEGGKEGGEIVVTGTPEEIIKHATSHTSRYLKKHLSLF